MPTTTVTLAWAIEVPIVTLCAHLEAYVNLKPTLDELRLCHRFGQGDKAAISRLPVELLQHIESYLLEPERRKLTKAFGKGFRCWQGQCLPIDHLAKQEQLECHNDIHKNLVEWDDELRNWTPSEKWSLEVKQFMEEWIKDCDYDGERIYWGEEHDERQQSWFQKVGSPAEAERGLFERLKSHLLKDMGLCAWISHSQDGPKPKEHTENGVTGTTKAYLHLPNPLSALHTWSPDYYNAEYDPIRVKTEASYECNLIIPPAPNESGLRRFGRAVKILGLKAKSKKRAEVEDADNVEENAASATNFEDEYVPKLKMLIRNTDDEEW